MFWLLLSSQGFNFPTLPLQRVGWDCTRHWEGTQPGQLTPTDQRDIPYQVTLCSAIKAKRKEEEEGALVITAFVFRSNCYAYWGPASQEVAGHHLLMGSRESVFCFPLLPCVALAFSLLNCLYLDPWEFFPFYFLPPCPAEEGSDRVAWWAPGVQPRSTHQRKSRPCKNHQEAHYTWCRWQVPPAQNITTSHFPD